MSTRMVVGSWPARKNRAYNPFQWLMAESLNKMDVDVVEFDPRTACFQKLDIWHWHWPDGQFAGSRPAILARYVWLNVLLTFARCRGVPIIWTAHNLEGHGASWPTLEERFRRRFLTALSAVHYLSSSSRGEAEARYPVLRTKMSLVTRHPDYRAVAHRADGGAAKASLGLSPAVPVIAFAGTVSAYKGVVELVSAFRDMPSGSAQLLVAGSPHESLKAWASGLTEVSGVATRLGLLSEGEMDQVLSAADLAVFPYRRFSNSGSIVLALTLGTPVLAPRTLGTEELLSDIGGPHLILYDPPLSAETLQDALRGLAASIASGSVHVGVSPLDPAIFSWEVAANGLKDLYVKCLSPARLDGQAGRRPTGV